MFITIILLTCLVSLVAVYLWILNRRYSYFRLRGIPGPPATFFLGHFDTIWSCKSYSRQLQTWTRQFGSIFGLYEGTRPLYVVSDVDFLQEVFIQQFSSFHSHRVSFLYEISKTVHLISADYPRWRQQRHAINPAFSPAKLKLMTSLIDQCIESMMKKLDDISAKNKEFDIYKLYQRLTMDVICHCAFGIDTDMQNDLDSDIMAKAAIVSTQDLDRILLSKLSYLLPWLTPWLTQLVSSQIVLLRFLHKLMPIVFPDIMEKVPRFWLLSKIQEVIDVRIKSSATSKRVDLLQLMLDASSTRNEEDTNETGLTTDDIRANVFLFMVAGFDTTSTILAYCAYILATENEIQKKLQAEVDGLFEKEDLNYDTIAKMEYMDLFLREVLRMYPVTAGALSRICNRSTTVCGHAIDKGCIVQADILTVHYSVDLWGPEDPYRFVPERHLTKRHPVALLTFGVGPRSCIGIRFATMEIKMGLARLLRRYTVLPGEHLKEGLQLCESFLIQPDAVNIKVEKRHP